MATFQFTVGSVTYNAATAPAMEQDKVLSLISVKVMQTIFSNKPETPAQQSLVPLLLMLPQSVKQEVARILCAKVFIAGQSDNAVSVRDFESRMVEWNQVLSELIVGNFSDFFTWCQSVREEETPPATV